VQKIDEITNASAANIAKLPETFTQIKSPDGRRG